MKTSYYANVKNFKNKDKLIAISGDKGKLANFEGKSYTKLAPKKTFFYVEK